MESQIRVVVADDHKLVRDLFRFVLHEEENIQMVGEAANGTQAMYVIRDLKPDVLLLNDILPEMNAREFIPPIRRKSPNTKALMLSDTKDEAAIFQALRAGARGCISMNASSSDLIKAIRTVHRGELWIKRRLIAKYFENETGADPSEGAEKSVTDEVLTPRETEILRCLATGCTNKDIGETLFISDKTVKCHLNSIFRKIHVTRRLQAILYAINKGLA